ncbi:MAG TPA: glycerophosphodiester phosphodiesterase [Pyrinomonadaceae bacterium]
MTTKKRRPFFEASRNVPEVIAHRGGARQWPGETLFAFQQAMKIGVDVIEMDVRSTSDNVLVLIHNPTVEDTTDGQGAVHEHSLEQIKKLDAGYRWTEDDGKTFPFRGKGIVVPTLEEILREFPQARMNIEIKQTSPSIVAPLAQMIRDHGLTDRVLIASFSDSALKEFRRICPEVATSASGSELIKFVALNKVFPGSKDIPGADAIQVKSRFSILPFITERIVRAAHGFDFPIHAWTVNDKKEMQRLISLGVDGIITDLPGPLMELLDRLP